LCGEFEIGRLSKETFFTELEHMGIVPTPEFERLISHSAIGTATFSQLLQSLSRPSLSENVTLKQHHKQNDANLHFHSGKALKRVDPTRNATTFHQSALQDDPFQKMDTGHHLSKTQQFFRSSLFISIRSSNFFWHVFLVIQPASPQH